MNMTTPSGEVSPSVYGIRVKYYIFYDPPIVPQSDQVSFVNHFKQEVNVDGSLKWIWSLESSGVYIVSSLRVHIDNLVLPHSSDDAWVWNPLVPGKLNVLAWRVGLGKLPCMENLSRIGVNSSNLCRMCNEAPESEDHIFVGCPRAANCKNRLGGHQRLKVFHEAIMLYFLWVIWRYRNEKVHAESPRSKSVLSYEVQVLSHLWLNARKRSGQNLRLMRLCKDKDGLGIDSLKAFSALHLMVKGCGLWLSMLSMSDRWEWELEIDGEFTVSSTRLPTKNNLDAKNIDLPSMMCALCISDIEDVNDVFVFCDVENQI
uniref:Reverse transcriptase zinc-binding domain-containing protein n=1 Tax=Lactuca sativa TaxID=4236 RepID=A0A9R1V0G2_LACSA|nr:hypothetical protein LSAT_V11C700356500 [Lactuca sativa]